MIKVRLPILDLKGGWLDGNIACTLREDLTSIRGTNSRCRKMRPSLVHNLRVLVPVKRTIDYVGWNVE